MNTLNEAKNVKFCVYGTDKVFYTEQYGWNFLVAYVGHSVYSKPIKYCPYYASKLEVDDKNG